MPQRCAYWARGRVLLAADLHLGKVETFRALGAPIGADVGMAATREKLGRLRSAIEAADAGGGEGMTLAVVGDFLHAAPGTTPALVDEVVCWRASLPGHVRVVVVPGNHDRSMDAVASRAEIEVAGEALEVGPFILMHEPGEHPGRFTWAGHLHPAVCVGGRGDQIKLPCFHVGARVGILPAFSTFTGGVPVERRRGDRVFAIAGDRVIEVKPARRR